MNTPPGHYAPVRAVAGFIVAALCVAAGCSSDSGQLPVVEPSSVELTPADFTITGRVDFTTGDNCYHVVSRAIDTSIDEQQCVYWTTPYPMFFTTNSTASDGTPYIVMWIDPTVTIVSTGEWGSYRDTSGWTVFTTAASSSNVMALTARIEGDLVECEVGVRLACDS